MNIPLEIQQKILSYIEPNPVVYTRLAMVSKSWYSLFTSDEKWLALDFQGVKTGLFKHYLKPYDNAEDQNYLKVCWSDWSKCRIESELLYSRERHYIPFEDNRLSTLGLIRLHRDWRVYPNANKPPIIVRERYARVAIGLDYHTIALVGLDVLKDHPDLVDDCVRIDPLCLNWLNGEILWNYRALILALLKRGEYDLGEACCSLYRCYRNRDFLWEAVEYQPELVVLVKELGYDMDPVLKLKLVFYQYMLLNHPRDKINYMFSRSKQEIFSDVELWRAGIRAEPEMLYLASKNVLNDEEVITQAVQRRPRMLWEASARLRNNAAFCASLVNNQSWAFFHVPEPVKKKRTFRSRLTFKDFEDMWEEVPDYYWDDATVVRNAMKRDVNHFYRASARVKRNRELEVIAVGARLRHT